MSGFTKEFEHLLRARPTRTEIEDMLEIKFEKT